MAKAPPFVSKDAAAPDASAAAPMRFNKKSARKRKTGRSAPAQKALRQSGRFGGAR